MPQLHYAIDSDDGFSEPELVAVCGNDFRRTKKLTEDWREVTCPTCRKLSGFERQLSRKARSMISPEQDMAQSMEQALIFGAFLQSLSSPTPAQLWLERAAARLEAERDPIGEKKATRAQTIAKLLQRDGHDCWFCGLGLGEDISIEHLQPRTLGGTWDMGNLALAHVGCNQAAGHLSRIKKEALREEMRAEQKQEARR